MGFKDRMSDAMGSAVEAARERQAERQADPHRGDHYEAVVNKGDLNVGALTRNLNQRWQDGWRLAHVIEQHSNTVMIFERRAESVAQQPQPHVNQNDPPGPGYWRASDGNWYPPESRPATY